MMGESDPHRSMFYTLSLEKFVPADHPLRRIRPFIEDRQIRKICKPLYSERGRPSIPPEQLFLALIGGYLLDVPSERKLVMELAMDPEEYKKRLREQDRDQENGPQDPGNRTVNFRGEKRSNKTHRSTTDPDCCFASKGSTGTGAIPGYTVNAPMENRNRILLGIGVEIFQGSTSETEGCTKLLDRARRRLRHKPQTLGADKGYFSEEFIGAIFERGIEPHIAASSNGSQLAHTRVRMRQRGLGYELSQRCRKLIEELFGEAKDWHGMRRLRRRGRFKVRQEALLIGWVLNLKRISGLLEPAEVGS